MRFDNVVAYSGEGVPILVTFDFTVNSIANVRIWRSIFDSAICRAIEIKSSAAADPAQSNEASMSVMSIRETRMGSDKKNGGTVCTNTYGPGPVVEQSPRSGVYVRIDNPKAYIKALDITGNYFTSKDPGSSFINLDYINPKPPVMINAAAGARIRSAVILGNSFGEALDVTDTANMPAAILLGSDNVLFSGNTLQSAREGTEDPVSKVDYFVQATRANRNNILVGNVAANPLENAFLDETSFQLGEGRQIVANTGATAPIFRTKRLLSAFTTASTTSVNPTTLSLSLRANTLYQATGTFLWTSSATTTGAGFGFNVNVGTAVYASSCQTSTSTSATGQTAPAIYYARAPNLLQPVSSVDTANATMLAHCTATFRTNAAAGRLFAQMLASNATNVTLLPNSFVELRELPQS